jgi:hypothetical protein
MDCRRFILAGNYGSGKTNLAVNLALAKRAEGFQTALLDLDIVNPYFISTDSREILEKHGVRLVSPLYANTNVDIPAIPPQARGLFEPDYPGVVVCDVGGGDSGAVALGQFAEKIGASGYELHAVVNPYRPFSATPEAALEALAEVESACRLKFTKIAANPNLGRETTLKTVLDSIPYFERLSAACGLEIAFLSATEALAPELEGRVPWKIMPIKIYTKSAWDIY